MSKIGTLCLCTVRIYLKKIFFMNSRQFLCCCERTVISVKSGDCVLATYSVVIPECVPGVPPIVVVDVGHVVFIVYTH